MRISDWSADVCSSDLALPEHLEGVDGIHMHTLCEQDFPPLERTWAAVQPLLRPHVPALKWINFGGGHHITRADYQPGDLVAFLNRVRADPACDALIAIGRASWRESGGKYV